MPAIDLAHADLTGSEQRPEQHGRGIRRWQHGLRLDPSLEFLVQPLNGVGGAGAAPLIIPTKASSASILSGAHDRCIR